MTRSEDKRWWTDPSWVSVLVFLVIVLPYPILRFGLGWFK